MTPDNLTKQDREALAAYRAMPPEYRPAFNRFLFRIVNDYPVAKAEALFWRDVGAVKRAAAGD